MIRPVSMELATTEFRGFSPGLFLPGFVPFMLEDLNEGLLACDDRGTLLCANRVAREIFEEELADVGSLARALDGSTGPFPLRRALAGETFADLEFVYPRKNVVLCFSGGPVKNAAGWLYGAVVTFRVLPPAVNQSGSEANLQGEEDADRVALLACHDLRAQFASIAILTDAATHETDDELKKDYLREAGIIARQSMDLVEDIFDVGALKTERQSGPPAGEFYLEDLARDVNRVCRPLASRKEIELVFDRFHGPVRGNSRRLMQVVQNLVTNSIKFSQPGTRVRVQARKRGGRIRIAVADEGMGMSSEQRAQVMSGSVKGRRTGTAGERSLGYGLFLVREILEANESELRLTSRSGQGSTFFFYLESV